MSRRPKTPKPEEPALSPAGSVLPMQLKVGDRFADKTGEWEDRELPQAGPALIIESSAKALHRNSRARKLSPWRT